MIEDTGQQPPTDGLDRLIQSDPTLSNAARLMIDADLLARHGRYSSVVGLAVLALEEIGKYLLKRWSSADPAFTYDRNRLHAMKQRAIATLFLTDGMRKEYKARGIDFSDLGTPEKMAGLIRAIRAGAKQEELFAARVKGKVLEIVKWSGLYYDEDLAAKGIEPAKITEGAAREIMGLCSRAFTLLGDEGNMNIAQAVFPSLLDGAKK